MFASGAFQLIPARSNRHPPSCTMDSGPVLGACERMHSRPHLKTYFLILVMIIAGPVGNVLLAKAMKSAGAVNYWPPSGLFDTFLRVFGHWTIWVGISCLIAFIVA